MRTQSLFRGTIAVPAMLFSFNSAALQSVRTDFGELVGEEEYVGILSSMPLKHNADGSLDIYIQAKSPGSHKESNWLLPPERDVQLDLPHLPARAGGIGRDLQAATGGQDAVSSRLGDGPCGLTADRSAWALTQPLKFLRRASDPLVFFQ